MTLGAELKTLADPVLGGKVYRDDVPEGVTLPAASFNEALSDVPALSGSAQTLKRRRLVQLDVWQLRASENLDLLAALLTAVDGHQTSSGRWRWVDTQRLVEDDVVHHAATLAVHHG